MAEKLFIIDGHSQIMRLYWSPLGNLTSSAGEPTKATYLFSQLIINILEKQKLDYLVIAMDPPGGAKRRIELYPKYKAGRDKMPDDLVPQIKRIRQILDTAGIPTIIFEGEEADDVIATIVEKTKDTDIEIQIISRDKDLYQLLGPKVTLYDPQNDEVINSEFLETKKGFRTDEFLEIQSLTGDKVDNVPGIPGVGIKTAASLIRKYGTAKSVIDHSNELTPKLRKNIEDFGSMVDLTKSLVTLRRDCPFDFDLESCRISAFNLKNLVPIFKELEFTRLLKSISKDFETETTSKKKQLDNSSSFCFESAYERNDLLTLRENLINAGIFAVDTETTSLQTREARLVGISFAWNCEKGVYVPILSQSGKTASSEDVQELLIPILENPDIKKIGQNLKYDLQVFRNAKIELRGIIFDTMIASYLLNSQRQSHGLDFLAREFLNYETIPISKVIGERTEQISIETADPDLLSTYAAEDALVTWRLWEKMAPELSAQGLEKLFLEVELPLVEVLADMEWNGIKIDKDILKKISVEFTGKLDTLQKEIWKYTGRQFNINSPKQLAEILFDELGLPVVKRTKTSRSTNAEVLHTLSVSNDNPIPGKVIRYRELMKLKNTYVDVLPKMISPSSGKLHPNYHQTVTATGRLSSSNPNIQNIPIRTEEGKRIREAFVPEGEHCLLLSFDYSQVELRILAHLSHDPGLCEAFDADEDIHSWVAGKIWGIPPTEIPPNLRSQAKAVNFGIIYGQTAFGLSKKLGIPRSEASLFIKEYKDKFKKITDFVNKTIEETRTKGFVQTILGRKRAIPEIDSRNRVKRQQAERFAVNTVIQGSAADLIKAAMISIHKKIKSGKLPAHLLIQVHDELIFEIPEEKIELCSEIIEKEMVGALSFSVPLKVDTAIGKSWPK